MLHTEINFFSKVFEEFHRRDRLAKFKIEISSKEPLWPQWPPMHLKTPNQIAGNLLAAGQRKNKILTKMKHTEDNLMLGIYFLYDLIYIEVEINIYLLIRKFKLYL